MAMAAAAAVTAVVATAGECTRGGKCETLFRRRESGARKMSIAPAAIKIRIVAMELVRERDYSQIYLTGKSRAISRYQERSV